MAMLNYQRVGTSKYKCHPSMMWSPKLELCTHGCKPIYLSLQKNG